MEQSPRQKSDLSLYSTTERTQHKCTCFASSKQSGWWNSSDNITGKLRALYLSQNDKLKTQPFKIATWDSYHSAALKITLIKWHLSTLKVNYNELPTLNALYLQGTFTQPSSIPLFDVVHTLLMPPFLCMLAVHISLRNII
ncbi:hypothetical protein BsWGS_05259 [Bradybaena similaris]